MDSSDFLASLRKRNIPVTIDGKLPRLSADDLETVIKLNPNLVVKHLDELRIQADSDPQIALRTPLTPKQYEAAGFMKDDRGRYVHPFGDEAGEEALKTVYSFAEAARLHAEALEHHKRFHWDRGGDPRPQQDLILREGRHPGHFVGTMRRGIGYRKLKFPD